MMTVVLFALLACFAIALCDSYLENSPDYAVVSSGYAGVPPLVMDPNVLVDDEGTHLFYSTYFCKQANGSFYYSWDPKSNEQCNIDGYISALGYAFSANLGYTWEFRGPPVFSPGGEEWEQYKVETAFVYNNGSALQLYYSAIGYQNGVLLDNRYQLGVSFLHLNNRTIREALLLSEDNFQRYRSSPLVPFDTTQSSFTNNVQEPSVVFRDNHYEVFFLGLQFSQPAQSPDSPSQSIELIGLGKAVFDLDFNLLNVSSAPLRNTAWSVNIPEVSYSAERDEYVLISSTLGDGGEVHHNEYLQLSNSRDGEDWTSPRAVLKPPGGEGFNGWAATSPTMLIGAGGADSIVVFYSAFSANATSNGGACDYSTRYGIPVPDPACIYVTLGRAVNP